MWSWWLCDTISGDKMLEVEPSAGGWGRRLNSAAGGFAHTFPLGERVHTRAEWRDATRPWASTLVQCWESDPVYSGLITGRPYDRDRQMLTLRSTDLRTLFLARYPFGVNSYWEDEGLQIVGRLVITGKSLEAAVAMVLTMAMQGPVGAADYTLPVVLGSTSTAGSFSTVYENYHFQKAADILDEIQAQQGGPDTDFAPEWTGSGTHQWVARVGALTGGSFNFDFTDPDCPVSSYKTDEDGLKQVTGVFGLGQGYNAAMVIGGTPGVPVADIPARDDVAIWKTVKTNDHAAELAAERVAAYKDPTFQPIIKVPASLVDPRTLILGSTITVTDDNDPFLPDGPNEYRLIGLSGTLEEEMTLTVGEVPA